MDQTTESTVKEILTLILSTLRQAEADDLTVAEARQQIEAAARVRWGLEPEFLKSLEGEPSGLTFEQWLDAAVDLLPAGVVIGVNVRELRDWYSRSLPLEEAAERIRQINEAKLWQ